MKFLASILLAGAATLLAAPSARAADFTPAFAASRAGGYVDLWPFDDGIVTTFGAELQLRLTRHVFLDMSFSAAFVDLSPNLEDFEHGAYGNPTFGAHYAGEATSKLQFFVGGSLTAPLLADPNAQVARADRFTVGHFALRAAGGIEWQIARPFYLRAEVRPLVYIPLPDRNAIFSPNRDPTFVLEQAVEFEGRLRSGLGFGGRLQGVAIANASDGFQAVAEPFMALTPPSGRGLYLRLGFPLALDNQLGFGLDRNKLATVRFAIGGQW